jgi:flagellar hook-length control protein FliK
VGAPTDISAVINSAAGSPGQPQAAVDHGKGTDVSPTTTAGAAGSGVGAAAGTGAGQSAALTPVINSAAGPPGQPQAAVDHGKGTAASATATAGAQGLGQRAPHGNAVGAAGSPGQPQAAVDHGKGTDVSAVATAGAQGLGQRVPHGIPTGTAGPDGTDHGKGGGDTAPATGADGATFGLPAGASTVSTTANPATTNAAATANTTVSVPDPQPALTSALARLHVGANGTQQLTVQLHPAELGAVNVTATINNGTLNVTVACADQAARAAVTAALPNLHHQLSTAGFSGVDVNFGGPSQQAPQQQADPRSYGGYPAGGSADPGPAVGPSGSASAHASAARLRARNAGLDRLL